MKKILLLIVCLILFGNEVPAQGDYFAPIGADWYYGAKSQYNYPHYSVFRAEKDTMMAGVNCRKITGSYVPLDSAARPLDNIYVYSTPDTVYYYNHTFERFTPLYIFSAEVGDTVTYNVPYFMYLPHFGFMLSTPPDDSVYSFYVKAKEPINVDGISLKKMTIFPNNGFWSYGRDGSYIERIGSSFLFIPFIPGGHIPEMMEISLRCYTDHEISYRVPSACDAFFPEPITVAPIKYPGNNIFISPNPSKGNFKIKLMHSSPEPVSLFLVDMMGRVIREIVIPEGQEELLFSMNLPAGIYVLKYTDGNMLHTHKLTIEL